MEQQCIRCKKYKEGSYGNVYFGKLIDEYDTRQTHNKVYKMTGKTNEFICNDCNNRMYLRNVLIYTISIIIMNAVLVLIFLSEEGDKQSFWYYWLCVFWSFASVGVIIAWILFPISKFIRKIIFTTSPNQVDNNLKEIMIKRGENEFTYFTEEEYQKISKDNFIKREGLKKVGLEHVHDKNLEESVKKYNEKNKIDMDRIEKLKRTYRSMSGEELKLKYNEMLKNKNDYTEEALIAIKDMLEEET